MSQSEQNKGRARGRSSRNLGRQSGKSSDSKKRCPKFKEFIKRTQTYISKFTVVSHKSIDIFTASVDKESLSVTAEFDKINNSGAKYGIYLTYKPPSGNSTKSKVLEVQYPKINKFDNSEHDMYKIVPADTRNRVYYTVKDSSNTIYRYFDDRGGGCSINGVSIWFSNNFTMKDANGKSDDIISVSNSNNTRVDIIIDPRTGLPGIKTYKDNQEHYYSILSWKPMEYNIHDRTNFGINEVITEFNRRTDLGITITRAERKSNIQTQRNDRGSNEPRESRGDKDDKNKDSEEVEQFLDVKTNIQYPSQLVGAYDKLVYQVSSVAKTVSRTTSMSADGLLVDKLIVLKQLQNYIGKTRTIMAEWNAFTVNPEISKLFMSYYANELSLMMKFANNL